MLKRLVKHGHSRAIVIDKALLQAAGLKEDANFQVIVNPNGGLLIQSITNENEDRFEKEFKALSTDLFDLMKSLSKK